MAIDFLVYLHVAHALPYNSSDTHNIRYVSEARRLISFFALYGSKKRE